jgi:hypothetical protein
MPTLKDVWEAHEALTQHRQLAARLQRRTTNNATAESNAALFDYVARKCVHLEQRLALLREQTNARDDQLNAPGAFLTFLTTRRGGNSNAGGSVSVAQVESDLSNADNSNSSNLNGTSSSTAGNNNGDEFSTDGQQTFGDEFDGDGFDANNNNNANDGGWDDEGTIRMLSKNEVEQLASYFGEDSTRLARLVRAQAAARGFVARQRYKEIRKKARQRVNILDEILKTESAFCSSLAIACDLFLAPIRTQNALTENEIACVFGNIEQILGFSRELLAALAARLKTITAFSCIGDVFVQFVPYMKVFNEYCKNYDRCAAFLKESAKNPVSPFNNICNEVSSNPTVGNQSLSSYLIMPVQRLPRYRLLLVDLLAKTWPAHADFEALERALDGVSRAAIGVNAFVKASDGAAKVIWMEKTIKGVGDLVTPTRVFIKEGLIGVRSAGSASTSKMRLFLCNDLLVVGTNEKHPVCKYRLPLEQVTVVDVEDMQSIQNAFQVIGNNASLTLLCTNVGEKTYWMSDLKKTINLLVAGVVDEAAAGAAGGDAAAALQSGASGRIALRRPSRTTTGGYRVNVVGTETRVAAKEYTVYVVNVVDQFNGRDFNIFRRFSDFDDLHAKLKKKLGANVPLLPKKQIFSSMSAKVMENRKIGLGSFLQQLAMRDGLIDGDPDVRAFLELDLPRDKQDEQLITVFLLDNSKKAFKVKPLLRSSELCALLASKSRLSDADARTFAVFVVTDETERALQPDDHPLDVLASWSGQSRLVYRKALFRKSDVDGSVTGDAHRQLMYIQAVWDVLSGVYPTDDAEALQLAALHCACQFGSAKSAQTINLAGLIDRYVPARLLKRRTPQQWEGDILHAHRTLSDEDAAQPQIAYLARVRQRPYYGARFFNHVESMQIPHLPSNVKLAVRFDGILVLDEKMALLAFFEAATVRIATTPKTITFTQSLKEWKFKTREGFAIETCVRTNQQL